MADIKIITAPSVYVLARPSLDGAELARFLADTGYPAWTTDAPTDAQAVVEVSARLCYRSFGRGRPHGEHIAHLIEAAHLSTFEHAQWTLLITGVSRALTHELVRHRHLQFSQESQRFVDASEVAFVVPPAMADEAAAWVADREGQIDTPFDKWVEQGLAAVSRYRAMCDSLGSDGTARKAVREAARSVLPNCAETRIAVSGNARAWREVLGKRLSPAADAEFRRLAEIIRGVLVKEAPGLFAGL